MRRVREGLGGGGRSLRSGLMMSLRSGSWMSLRSGRKEPENN